VSSLDPRQGSLFHTHTNTTSNTHTHTNTDTRRGWHLDHQWVLLEFLQTEGHVICFGNDLLAVLASAALAVVLT